MNTEIRAPLDGDWESALHRLTKSWRSIVMAINLAPPTHQPVQGVLVNDTSFDLLCEGKEPLRINLVPGGE